GNGTGVFRRLQSPVPMAALAVLIDEDKIHSIVTFAKVKSAHDPDKQFAPNTRGVCDALVCGKRRNRVNVAEIHGGSALRTYAKIRSRDIAGIKLRHVRGYGKRGFIADAKIENGSLMMDFAIEGIVA